MYATHSWNSHQQLCSVLICSCCSCCEREKRTASCCGRSMAVASGKKLRKPYTITRPRERWTADEHDRFLHALLLFGRDWKRIQQLVATKTATQIRSHAEKHFLKAHKLGLASALPPPPHHRRAAFLIPQPPIYSGNAAAAAVLGMAPESGVRQSEEWACASAGAWRPAHGSFMETPNCSEAQAGASPSEAWFADASLPDETIHLPLSPDDPHFGQVYRFIGDVFGSGETQLQRLQGMEPVVVETTLLVLSNLEANLSA